MICIPIAAPSTEAAIEKIRRAEALADLIELRIDQIPDADLERLLSARHCPVIVTNRCRLEGGAFDGTEEERLARLKEAANLGADYIDVEVSTASAEKAGLRRFIADTATQLILSWHDFSGTPSAESLEAKLRECMTDSPAIVKIVTLARTAADCLRLLELIPRARTKGQSIAAFCMGRPGRISRIMAPLLGSVFSYAALDGSETSAPGQLTVRQIKEIYRIMDEGNRHE